jgi:hypothetical protein
MKRTIMIADKIYNDRVVIPLKTLKGICFEDLIDITVGFSKDDDNPGKIENIIGRVTDVKEEDGELITDIEFCRDNKVVKDIIKNPDDYFFYPRFTLTPICSQCGEDFRDCEHFFDRAYVIAKDIKIDFVGVIPKKDDKVKCELKE